MNTLTNTLKKLYSGSSRKAVVAVVAAVAVLIVGFATMASRASGFFAATEAEAGTLSGNVHLVSDSAAAGGTAVQFTAPVTGGGGGGGTGGGGSTGTNPYPDRWSVGAPGVAHYNQTQANLPVPAGYTVVSGNGTPGEWDIYDCSSPVVYDHYYFKAFIYIGTNCSGSITIKNSIIAPPAGTRQRSILNNSSGGVNLTIQDSTIRPEPVPLGGTNDALTDHMVNGCGSTCHVTLTRLDVSNSGGMCLCGENTLVQYSWLHDAYVAHLPDPSLAHTGGVFPIGGTGPVEVSHSRLEPGFNVGTGTEVTNYWQAITAVLFTQPGDGGPQLRNYNVHDNFISLGAYDMALQEGIGIIVKNNVFGPSHWGAANCSGGCSVTYADWSSNVLGDINGVPSTSVVNHP
ncbi:MAG TPA: hypothetical protein VLI54_00580 [Bacillota bacterium]|nr:hypothetical protein [Bacillota bacterium]